MKKLLIIFLILISPTMMANETEIVAFLNSHLKLLEQQEVEGSINNLHSKGKNRAKSIKDLRMKLPGMKFKYKIMESSYIGKDEEFHYIRYKQRTFFNEQWQKMAKVKGIEMDCITILGIEDGKYKIFDTYLFSQTKLKD